MASAQNVHGLECDKTSLDISLSQEEEIAQLTRSIQSIVDGDRRIQDLMKDDIESERKPAPTLWLG